MTWYEKLKFSSNPLDVRPNTSLIGLEREEALLKNHIEKEEICFLNGLTGSGKTSLLMKLQKEMKGHNFVYLDAHDLPDSFNLEEELRSKRSFFDRLLLRNSPRRKPVLIIDEFQATDPDVVLEARAKWENPNDKRIRSIIISQISRHLRNITPSFKERLGSRIVQLRTLDEDELKGIITKRLRKGRKLNYADKLSDDALTFIVRCSGGNPRRLLEYADEIFDFHHSKFGDKNPMLLKNYTVSYHGAREILGLDKVYVEGFSHLDDRKAVISSITRDAPDRFENRFTPAERKVLRYMKSSPKTTGQVAKRLKVSMSSASRLLAGLKDKEAILFAGKQKGTRKSLWQIEPSTKRMMVKV